MAFTPGEGLAWERLGDALIQRRIDLHYRNRRAFCDTRQIDYRLTFDIEKHRRTNFAKPTMLDIARAYAVTPESIDRLLHGQGDLEPLPEAPPAARTPEPAADRTDSTVPSQVGSAISDVVVQVNRARMRHGTATAEQIFPDPLEVRAWNLAWPEPDRIEYIAWLRVKRADPQAGEEAGHVPHRVQ